MIRNHTISTVNAKVRLHLPCRCNMQCNQYDKTAPKAGLTGGASILGSELKKLGRKQACMGDVAWDGGGRGLCFFSHGMAWLRAYAGTRAKKAKPDKQVLD